jgi:periplasmic protein TonB
MLPAAPPAESQAATTVGPRVADVPTPGRVDAASDEALEEPGFGAAYLNNPPPEYPRISQRRREEGTVLLWVAVAADGRPVDWRVERSSGHERLDQAALDAVAGWRFEPARRGLRPVAGSVLVPMEFRLQ